MDLCRVVLAVDLCAVGIALEVVVGYKGEGSGDFVDVE